MNTNRRVVRRTAEVSALLLSLGLFLACGSPADDPDWSQWRGPGGQGISNRAELPRSWNEDGAGIKWSSTIDGEGTSSPIALGRTVYLTSAKRIRREVDLQVHGFDLESGDQHWSTTIARRTRERAHRMNGPAGPTPVSDGESLFVYFGSHLAALDMDGEIRWVEEIDSNYLEESRYAAGSSLVLHDDLVIVLRDRERVDEELIGWIAAYDKSTGDTVWKRDWQDSCCSYTTPFFLKGRSDTPELVVVLAGAILILDPLTGEVLGRVEQTIAQPVASPVSEGNLICLASGAHANRQAGCWELEDGVGASRWRALWSYAKWVPDTASPILLDGRLFLLTEKGILRCVDARTGELIWRSRLGTAGHRASLLAGAGRIYALGESGTVTVFSPADGKVVAENTLPGSEYFASPAVAGNCILFRSGSALHCVDGVE